MHKIICYCTFNKINTRFHPLVFRPKVGAEAEIESLKIEHENSWLQGAKYWEHYNWPPAHHWDRITVMSLSEARMREFETHQYQNPGHQQ
jgi:hypothetical protein